jgi:hypothetical protein
VSADNADYFLRILMSETRVDHLTVGKSDAGLGQEIRSVEGPIAFLVTTTDVSLHPENETRVLSIPVDDSREQTKLVMRALARARQHGAYHQDERELKIWHSLQTWIEGACHEVVIPFAEDIAELTPPVATRQRRDTGDLFDLISTHAILHQATREKSAEGLIIATYDDYQAIRALAGDILARGASTSVATEVREVVAAVHQLNPNYDEDTAVTITRLTATMKLDRSTVTRRVKEAVQLGFLRNLAPARKPYRLILGDPIPEDRTLLPEVKWLLKAREAREAASGRPSPLPDDGQGQSDEVAA